MADFIIILVLLVLAGLALRTCLRKKSCGSGCSGGCGTCSGNCHRHNTPRKD
jgi:hypothetical protein